MAYGASEDEAVHDREEVGLAALSKIGKDTGLRPNDLRSLVKG
jgi:hypothetical protein